MKKTLICVTAIMLVACTTADYKKYDGHYGYKETRISDDGYIVEYNSDNKMSEIDNYKYSLRRAAELCNKTGHKYFTIVEKMDTSIRYTEPTISKTDNNGEHSKTVVVGGEKRIRPGVALTIRMYDEKVPGAYEASTVLDNFKQ